MSKKLCPCGSNQKYKSCCLTYISGQANAPTPEALMRSRYTAYSKAKINYIIKTMRGPASEKFDAAGAKEWAEQIDWQQLQIIDVSEIIDDVGYVEFIASYKYNQQLQQLHEKSEFHFIDNLWYYITSVSECCDCKDH